MRKNRNNYSLMEKNNFDVINNQVHDKINQDDKKNIYIMLLVIILFAY